VYLAPTAQTEPPMDNLILITTTSNDREELEKIAAHLVERKLGACCQISGPISSWYRWNGKLESTQEWVCSIKTLKSRFPEAEIAISTLHHFDEPQIVAIDICAASEGYENWVRQCVAV
jgi:periplasmic divalent cation tolerance protein